MTENSEFPNVPAAESAPRNRTRLSVVWIIPVVAAVVGFGIAVQRYLSEGPTIRIAFRSAEGVEAGKTPIKYKDVEIGKVTAVTLSKDYSRILVMAKMEKDAEGLMVEDARFWIVKPRVTLGGISGIGTLLSGNYIGFERGKSARTGHDFSGLETPPPLASGAPGREFLLRADTLGSLGVGSPVYYRRLNVGQVISYDLTPDGKAVDIRIFLNTPFDRYVNPNTRFWEASGIDMGLGADGLSVRTESLLSLLVGGIAFETPPPAAWDNSAGDNSVFPLSKDRGTALSPREKEADRFALYFDESLRGLSAGAPVDFLGLPVGEVTGVFLDYLPGSRDIRTRVEIETYRYRFLPYLEKSGDAAARILEGKELHGFLQLQVAEKGLRAQLRSGSLISGQLYVALDFFPDAPEARIDWTRKPPRFPVVPGEAAKIKNIIAKLDKVPLEEIGRDLKKALASLDRTLNRLEGETLPEAKLTLASLGRTMETADRALNRFDGEIVPEAKRTLEDLRRAIGSAERVLSNADNAFLAPDAPARQEMRDALREIARAARAVRGLADYLERDPNALIRGKAREKP